MTGIEPTTEETVNGFHGNLLGSVYVSTKDVPSMYQARIYIYTHYTYVSIPSIYYVDYVDNWFNLCLKSRPSFEENKVQPAESPTSFCSS